jgi:hypothetical protein
VTEVPAPDEARERWQRLPRKVQDRVVKSARRGEPYPDPEVAALAVGWAWAVLGRPGDRRPVSAVRRFYAFASALIEGGGGPGMNVGSTVFNGDPEWDALPAVRKAAERVEAVNLPVVSGPPPGTRVAALTSDRRRGYLAVDQQEWRPAGRERRYEARDRWRISLASGEHDEGLFTAAELAELGAGLFTYRGDALRVEWLSGDEAGAAHAGHFAGWD